MQDLALSKYQKNHEKIETINMSYLGEDLFNNTEYCIRFEGKKQNQTIEEETLLLEEFFSKKNEIKEVRKIIKGKKILSCIVVETDYSDDSEKKLENFSIKTLFENLLGIIQTTLLEVFHVFDGHKNENFCNNYCRNSILNKNKGEKFGHKSNRVHGSYSDEVYIARSL